MSVMDTVRKIVPWIGAAASTALPGPLAATAQIITKALSTAEKPLKVEPTVEGIQNAVMSALGDPEKLAKLRAEDDQFRMAWQEAGFQHEEDLAKVAAEDRASARARQMALRDWMPPVLGLLITIGFFASLFLVFVRGVNSQARDLANIMLGSLGTAWIAVVTYYFGSSLGSERKTELLAPKEPGR